MRLQTRLSSDTAQVEDRFEATTVADLYRGNDVLIPAGSLVRGVVRSVDRATRTDRTGELTVSFDQITIRGRTYPMRGTVTEALESEGLKGEAGRIGAGAGVGAIIGGILGGVKGALLGVLIGGGGTIAATEGKDVTLEPGTMLRVRLDDAAESSGKRGEGRTRGATSSCRRRAACARPRGTTPRTATAADRCRCRQHRAMERAVPVGIGRHRRFEDRAPDRIVKNGVSSEPNALTCRATPASRAASARPAASRAVSAVEMLVELRREVLQRP